MTGGPSDAPLPSGMIRRDRQLAKFGKSSPTGLIGQLSFTQRLRDYFNIATVDARRVALTQDQVDDYSLVVGGNIDDKEDVNKEAFRDEFGEATYEAEALKPTDLETIIEEAIQ
jgi:hypothetical protein